MKTKIISIDSKNPSLKEILKCSKIISKGGLVAFPTETVYGLGANALNSKAVKKIFLAKGRPSDNPLIVHISDINQIKDLTLEVPEKAKKLMERFWPGPLTIILKKSKVIPNIVTCNLKTVALRMPNNKIALELIKNSKCPIAAPSANISSKPSSTEVKHVIKDLSGKIDAIIDGGKSEIGIESTVLDLTTNHPIILRPGMITKNQIESVIGKIDILNPKSRISITKSPGIKYRHYSPNAKVILLNSKVYKKDLIRLSKLNNSAILCTNKNHHHKHLSIFLGSSAKIVARNLFSSFRKLDDMGCSWIIVEPIGKGNEWKGIENRLKKSAYKIIG